MTKKSLSKSLPVSSKPKSQLLGLVLVVVSTFSLILSFVFLINTAIQLNRGEVPPQEGQLLNRPSIEKAAILLQEQTAVFETSE